MRHLTSRATRFTVLLLCAVAGAACPLPPGELSISSFTVTPGNACVTRSGTSFTISWAVTVNGRDTPIDIDNADKIDLRVLDSSDQEKFKVVLSQAGMVNFSGTRMQPFSALGLGAGSFQWQLRAMWEDGSHQVDRKIPFEVLPNDAWIDRPVVLKQVERSGRFNGDFTLTAAETDPSRFVDAIRLVALHADSVPPELARLKELHLIAPAGGPSLVCRGRQEANPGEARCDELPSAPPLGISGGVLPGGVVFGAFFPPPPAADGPPRSITAGFHLACRS